MMVVTAGCDEAASVDVAEETGKVVTGVLLVGAVVEALDVVFNGATLEAISDAPGAKRPPLFVGAADTVTLAGDEASD